MTKEQFESALTIAYKQGRNDEASGFASNTITIDLSGCEWLKDYYPVTEQVIYKYVNPPN